MEGNKKRNNLILLFFVLLALTIETLIIQGIGRYAASTAVEPTEIPYTEFLKLVEEGKVDKVIYSGSNELMKFYCFNDETKDMSYMERKEYEYPKEEAMLTLYPSYDTFRKDMLLSDIRLVLDKSLTFGEILGNIISLGLPLLWIFMIYRMMRNQVKGLDKKVLLQTSTVKFADVIGQDEILEDIQFITKLIKNPKVGDEVGAKTPKGVLLVGPPGTGKTLIAKAIAGESEVPFLSLSGSDFKELYVGLGAKRVRELFQLARKHAPCVVFIDEIDSVGAKRDRRGGNSEDDQTINALLKEMDGFTGRDGVFIIAATNRVDQLDSALLRSGRFDRQIMVNPPRDWHVREDMLKHYLKDMKVADDVDLEALAKQISGFTGADISMVCNEAGIIAVMQEKPRIDRACIEEAIDKKVFHGNRSKDDKQNDDRLVVAYHEAGHAVETYLCNEPISRITIQGTTSGVGGAVFGGDKDRHLTTDEEMRNRVKIAYAGRASEEIKFNKLTIGAQNDITQATELMRQYVQSFGFDRDFGLLDMKVLNEYNLINNDDITRRLSEMSKQLYDSTLKDLRDNYHLVERLAARLLEVETLSGAEVINLFENN